MLNWTSWLKSGGSSTNPVLDIAAWCLERAADDSGFISRVRDEMTRGMIALHNLGEKRGTLDSEAIRVHKGRHSSGGEKPFNVFEAQDFDGIHDTCQMIWIASLPLEQISSSHLTRVLGSSCARVRNSWILCQQVADCAP